MYLYKKTYVQNWEHTSPEKKHTISIKKGGKVRKDIKPERICYITEQIAYWRKFNALHGWFIENCGGGLAVRNVTCGSRLSNHSWGTAIDMNTTKYPYGYKFKPDGIYAGNAKIRDLNEFDRGFQQVAAIFKSQGMTWLSNNDPMHVSIYE